MWSSGREVNMKQTAIAPNALKLWFVPGMISLVLMFSLFLFACESFDEALFGNSAANTYSNTCETELVYTFYNNSSVSITIEDSTGAVTIPSGGSQQGVTAEV
jgi:hypothetical protein